MQRMGEFLARAGYVAFAVDYRLFHGAENRWPAQLDDALRAVRWVRANAASVVERGASRKVKGSTFSASFRFARV